MEAVNLTEEEEALADGIGVAIVDVIEETARQAEKWGVQNHDPSGWMLILMEEVGEASKEVLEFTFDSQKGVQGLDNLEKEMVQVAAVAVSAVESIRRWRREIGL
jgi:NTP pyrophosphatase (non-canonical NTP hydrolase)